MLPNTFIVGAPKCGTTSLWSILNQHPQIEFSRIKEPNRYNADLRLAFGSMRYRDSRLYESLFEDLSATRVGEASVWYLHSRVAIQRLIRASPDARIFVCLRPPADAVRSMHAFSFRLGGEDIPDLEAAWNATSRVAPAGVQVLDSLDYREIFRFAEQLERLFEHVPREQVHVVLLEDLQKDPVSSAKEAFEFLDVDPFVPEAVIANKTAEQADRPFAHISRRHPRARRLLVRLTTESARARLRAFGVRVTRRQSLVPTASPEFMAKLRDHFQPQVEQLEQVLQRDLGSWKAR